jgi:beta-N-acetylhexosaminidase
MPSGFFMLIARFGAGGLKAWLRAGLALMAIAGGIASAAAADLPPTDELYGQLLIVGFTGTEPDDPGVRQAREDLRLGRIGGLIAFERNIVDEDQVARLMAHLRATPSAHLPFLAIDQEGGAVQRLAEIASISRVPSARWVAANASAEEARTLYGRMAAAMAGLGFNLNLAPVVDLDSGRRNPAIGRLGRSFGGDPAKVARYAGAFIEAHHAHGILTALKHWPGHGSSLADPHVALADVTATWREDELVPFMALFDAGKADMIMTGHVHHRFWGEGDGRPASLSRGAVGFGLRHKLGFEGVVVTDDLQMESALDGRSLGEAIVLALAAGNDIVLIANMLEYQPDVARYAIAAVKRAVADGRLDASALKRSYRRVVALKQRLRQ